MNKKIIVGIATVLVVVIVVAAVIFLLPSPAEQEELDFTISETGSEKMGLVVPMCYVPFKTEADEQWNLTIECTKMPLLSYTNVLLYNGYWDKGKDFKCTSEDISSIATELNTLETIGGDPEALKEQYPSQQDLYNTTTYTGIYGSSTPQSFTVFFAFPSSTYVGEFHVTLEKIE